MHAYRPKPMNRTDAGPGGIWQAASSWLLCVERSQRNAQIRWAHVEMSGCVGLMGCTERSVHTTITDRLGFGVLEDEQTKSRLRQRSPKFGKRSLDFTDSEI